VGKQLFEGKRQDMFLVDPADVVVVGIDTPDGPEHFLYDERIKLDLDESMVRSIMHDGVIEPVVVTAIGGKPHVVDGRQRVRCAREANRRLEERGAEPVRVAIVNRRGRLEDLFGVSISANEVRRDDEPLQKGRKVQRYLAMGRTEEEAALAFGVSVQSVRNWLALIELDPTVRKRVETGELKPTAALQLQQLEPEAQREAAESLVERSKAGERVTTRTARRERQERQSASGNGKPASAINERPSLALIRAVVETGEKRKPPLSTEAVLVLRWVLGDVLTESLPGLAAVISDIEQARRTKPAKKRRS